MTQIHPNKKKDLSREISTFTINKLTKALDVSVNTLIEDGTEKECSQTNYNKV